MHEPCTDQLVQPGLRPFAWLLSVPWPALAVRDALVAPKGAERQREHAGKVQRQSAGTSLAGSGSFSTLPDA